MKKQISPAIKLKIISLSGKMFWFWRSFYNFYASVLGISSRELEMLVPRDQNKYSATEKIIEYLERKGDIDLQKLLLSELYKIPTPFDKEDNPSYKEAEKELRELKNMIGRDVLKEEENKIAFKKQLEEKRKKNELEKEKNRKIDSIKEEFFKQTISKDRVNAGFWLEKAFFDILDLEKIENVRPYRTKTEQIDGYFKYNKFDYLVEIKWTKEKVKQRDISIFDGKIKGKAQSTRGFIFSINGFDDSAIMAASGNSPRIIFMDHKDWIKVIERRGGFLDVLKTKEDRLTRKGEVYDLRQ